ncbi:MAG: RNA-binding S4 domain-containing protein [Bacillota bacterium]|jgi:ribosomal 50S subunit-recycling heat shock protein
MRLDKFLKVSRIIKRRTLAKEVCDGGKVFINNRPAKAGNEVKVGDILTIRLGSRQLKAEILFIADHVRADQAKELYTILEDVRINNEPVE